MGANCPIMWQSKLQSETAPSTIKAEIITLANSSWALFPIIDGVSIISKTIGILTIPSFKFHNAGAWCTSQSQNFIASIQSKHYHTKIIWFQDEMVNVGSSCLRFLLPSNEQIDWRLIKKIVDLIQVSTNATQ